MKKRYRVPFTIRGQAIVELDPAECGNAYPEWVAKGYVEGVFNLDRPLLIGDKILELCNVKLTTDDADELA